MRRVTLGSGNDLYIRPLSAMAALRDLNVEFVASSELQLIRLVQLSLCAEDGTRIFDDSETDFLELADWPATDVLAIANAVMELNELDIAPAAMEKKSAASRG